MLRQSGLARDVTFSKEPSRNREKQSNWPRWHVLYVDDSVAPDSFSTSQMHVVTVLALIIQEFFYHKPAQIRATSSIMQTIQPQTIKMFTCLTITAITSGPNKLERIRAASNT